MKAILAAVLALAPATGFAAEWKTLGENEILAVLAGASVEYIAARQEFLSSGDTIWDTGEKQLGHWTVNGGKYCSQWPPSSEITCYTVEQMVEDESRIRFTDPQGKVSNGRITGRK
ncbi:hypothetical protein PSA7680_02069 [Pseudoruegeria aquimaris]|uniref:DUF995 domain-containing protein n=1 Tax=Pseudoruegeria aquimaris TaxID=393663 RepID=A0A1Y5SIB8_9RHOB|nr:hypothetical protein [Pseudoruegeria aquimaris]SLN41488.1 hypothetical protein PSA7680_02069 [Pseudoruegeria aquimaris]